MRVMEEEEENKGKNEWGKGRMEKENDGSTYFLEL